MHGGHIGLHAARFAQPLNDIVLLKRQHVVLHFTKSDDLVKLRFHFFGGSRVCRLLFLFFHRDGKIRECEHKHTVFYAECAGNGLFTVLFRAAQLFFAQKAEATFRQPRHALHAVAATEFIRQKRRGIFTKRERVV